MTYSPRNIGLDLVRVTEAAALVAGRWMGLGRRDEADAEAGLAMLRGLETLEMDGRLVVGEEGRRADAPLRTGQAVGTGRGPELDVVVDPIDGRNLLALGRPGAIAVAAVAPRGAMWHPAPAVYMDKIVVDRDVAPHLVPECMGAPAAWTLALVARIKGKAVRDLVVFVLDRARHAPLVEEIRAAGARVMLSPDGDIAGAILAATHTARVDMLMGVGGVPEGVIAACAVKSLGGAMLGRLAPQTDDERAAAEAAGLDLRRVLTSDTLVSGRTIFFAATGITDGPLLGGVRYESRRAETDSLILRSETGTRRRITAEHLLDEKGP